MSLTLNGRVIVDGLPVTVRAGHTLTLPDGETGVIAEFEWSQMTGTHAEVVLPLIAAVRRNSFLKHARADYLPFPALTLPGHEDLSGPCYWCLREAPCECLGPETCMCSCGRCLA